MKNIKTILALFIFAFCILSCSKDEEAKPIAGPLKEYPANMIYQWDGTVRQTDFGFTTETALRWNIKANGVLEILNGAQPAIIGEWYMIGNVFTCNYTSNTAEKLTFQLLKSKTLNMVGFKGLNGETSGSGRVYIYVI